MRSKLIMAVYFIAALLSPLAYGQSAVAALHPSFNAPGSIPKRGTLYRVIHEGNAAYLFGTIHVGKASFYPLEPRVSEALSKSSKLVLELDVRNQQAFQAALAKHGLYGPNENIRDHIAPALYAQLLQALERYQFPAQRVMQMKPWLAANFLISLDTERGGFSRSFGIETYLMDAAVAQAKQVVELENAEYQLALFDGMSEQEQEQYLREILEGLADGSVTKKTQELIAAWSTADEKQYDALVREAMNEKSTSSEFTQRILLDKRNPEMTNKIEALLKNEATTFVGIGLLHMLGETSVPALLKQRGYAVEKVY
ncbi:MAG: TraB/GumN family protein [Burkholderiales bacterium]|nr:TraB/GumN family protein [Burkholderiales bacterium]